MTLCKLAYDRGYFYDLIQYYPQSRARWTCGISLTILIAIAVCVRTGCRGGAPGWRHSSHTPFYLNVLNQVATAIPNGLTRSFVLLILRWLLILWFYTRFCFSSSWRLSIGITILVRHLIKNFTAFWFFKVH